MQEKQASGFTESTPQVPQFLHPGPVGRDDTAFQSRRAEGEVAAYVLATGPEEKSSMKLHRDLDSAQQSVGHLAHHIREASVGGEVVFRGPMETDEHCSDSKRCNMPNAERKELEGTGRGAFGQTGPIAVKNCSTNRVLAQLVESVNKETANEILGQTLCPNALLCTDDSAVHEEDPALRKTAGHSVSEIVRGLAHATGIASFWPMLKRGCQGSHHKRPANHPGRYASEFSGRHNVRMADTLSEMELSARRMIRRRLRCQSMARASGLLSGARALSA